MAGGAAVPVTEPPMTVAAFFRQARASMVPGAEKAVSGTSLLADFRAHYALEECTPPQLLTLSDLAMRANDPDLARAALDRVISSGENAPLAHYRRGRLELAQEDPAAALLHFQAGAETGGNFPFNWMGVARALHAQSLNDAAVAPAERFLTFGVRPHSARDFAVLSALGDHLFDAGDRRRSLPFYEAVVRFGAGEPRDAVRLAEAMIVVNDHAGAQRVLLEQEQRGLLDKWGLRALALASSRLGDHARALAAGEAALAQNPHNAGFVGTYLDVLVRAGDTILIRGALARHAALLPREAASELSARLHIAGGDIEAAIGILNAQDIVYQSRLYYLTFETAYTALGAGLLDVALAMGDRLGEAAPADSFVKLLRIDIYFRQQMWEQAALVLQGMTDAEKQLPHVLLKQFEHACFIGDTPAALQLCATLEAMQQPDKQFMLPVFRFLAERKAWHQLVDRALPWLDAQFNYAQIGYVLFRAAKHTGRQADMIQAVQAVPHWHNHADLVKLRANLACDTAETLPAIEKLLRDPTITGDPLLSQRLAVKRDIVRRATAHGQRRAIFLCTDRNYLCATVVALHTASRAVDASTVDFFVVADDDVAEMCSRALAPFADTGITVTVLAASKVVDAAEKLYPAYGLFTSGHMLASAAYYRIYFARYLQRLGGYERVVYLDSDILVRAPLEDLFQTELHGRPLAARLETMRPEVRRAIALHRLADDRYFNSGVILFDLKNTRLSAGLDGAVSAIADDETTLLFHDQCALNLGFRADFTDMPKIWNFPVNEITRLQDVPSNAVILHFLDRPKPWSAAYGGEAGPLWFECWKQAAGVIGDAAAVMLFQQSED